MINIEYSELIKKPLDILVCGIPVRFQIKKYNSSKILVTLSCIHHFQDTNSQEIIMHCNVPHTITFKDKYEEILVHREFIIREF